MKRKYPYTQSEEYFAGLESDRYLILNIKGQQKRDLIALGRRTRVKPFLLARLALADFLRENNLLRMGATFDHVYEEAFRAGRYAHGLYDFNEVENPELIDHVRHSGYQEGSMQQFRWQQKMEKLEAERYERAASAAAPEYRPSAPASVPQPHPGPTPIPSPND